MGKPIDLVVAETKENILQILNSAGLPITILNLILSDIHGIVKAQEKATLDRLRAEEAKATE